MSPRVHLASVASKCCEKDSVQYIFVGCFGGVDEFFCWVVLGVPGVPSHDKVDALIPYFAVELSVETNRCLISRLALT